MRLISLCSVFVSAHWTSGQIQIKRHIGTSGDVLYLQWWKAVYLLKYCTISKYFLNFILSLHNISERHTVLFYSSTLSDSCMWWSLMIFNINYIIEVEIRTTTTHRNIHNTVKSHFVHEYFYFDTLTTFSYQYVSTCRTFSCEYFTVWCCYFYWGKRSEHFFHHCLCVLCLSRCIHTSGRQVSRLYLPDIIRYTDVVNSSDILKWGLLVCSPWCHRYEE